MSLHPFLRGEADQPLGLREVAVVDRRKRKLQVEAAQPHKPHDVVETCGCRTALPPRDARLRRPRALTQVGLGEASAAARLTNQVPTGTHATRYSTSVMP